MSPPKTPDNFAFADIPAPSTPGEARIVELVRLVVREELRKRDQDITDVSAELLEAFRIVRGLQ